MFLFFPATTNFAMELKDPIYIVLAKKDAKTNAKEFNSDEKAEYEKLYPQYEQHEKGLNKIKQAPEASMWGGINYTMTLTEMQQKVEEKFNELKKNKLILSKDQFEPIKDKYFLPRSNLTRVWGTDYLRSKINFSEMLRNKYDVPNYVIVLDNPNKASVNISFENEYFPQVFEVENGSIYFEKIMGTGISSWACPAVQDIGTKSGIGYNDFSDAGNIIMQEGTNKNYIVDTEEKSFKIRSLTINLLVYAWTRFRHLYSPDTFEFLHEFELK